MIPEAPLLFLGKQGENNRFITGGWCLPALLLQIHVAAGAKGFDPNILYCNVGYSSRLWCVKSQMHTQTQRALDILWFMFRDIYIYIYCSSMKKKGGWKGITHENEYANAGMSVFLMERDPPACVIHQWRCCIWWSVCGHTPQLNVPASCPRRASVLPASCLPRARVVPAKASGRTNGVLGEAP